MGERLFFSKLVTKNLTAVDSSRRLFEGVLTVEMKDRQGEITIRDELMKVLPIWIARGGPITDTHSNRVVGKGINYAATTVKDSNGVEYPSITIQGEIFRDYELDNEIWKAIKSGKYKGLSFGGATKTGRTPILQKDGSVAYSLKDLEQYEVAVCEEPAVPLALITQHNEIAKAMAGNSTDRGDGQMCIRCDKFKCYVEKKELSMHEMNRESKQKPGRFAFEDETKPGIPKSRTPNPNAKQLLEGTKESDFADASDLESKIDPYVESTTPIGFGTIQPNIARKLKNGEPYTDVKGKNTPNKDEEAEAFENNRGEPQENGTTYHGSNKADGGMSTADSGASESNFGGAGKKDEDKAIDEDNKEMLERADLEEEKKKEIKQEVEKFIGAIAGGIARGVAGAAGSALRGAGSAASRVGSKVGGAVNPGGDIAGALPIGGGGSDEGEDEGEVTKVFDFAEIPEEEMEKREKKILENKVPGTEFNQDKKRQEARYIETGKKIYPAERNRYIKEREKLTSATLDLLNIKLQDTLKNNKPHHVEKKQVSLHGMERESKQKPGRFAMQDEEKPGIPVSRLTNPNYHEYRHNVNENNLSGISDLETNITSDYWADRGFATIQPNVARKLTSATLDLLNTKLQDTLKATPWKELGHADSALPVGRNEFGGTNPFTGKKRKAPGKKTGTSGHVEEKPKHANQFQSSKGPTIGPDAPEITPKFHKTNQSEKEMADITRLKKLIQTYMKQNKGEFPTWKKIPAGWKEHYQKYGNLRWATDKAISATLELANLVFKIKMTPWSEPSGGGFAGDEPGVTKENEGDSYHDKINPNNKKTVNDKQADAHKKDSKKSEYITKPFAGYSNFKECVEKNQNKSDPEAYCGKIKHQVEKTDRALSANNSENGIKGKIRVSNDKAAEAFINQSISDITDLVFDVITKTPSTEGYGDAKIEGKNIDSEINPGKSKKTQVDRLINQSNSVKSAYDTAQQDTGNKSSRDVEEEECSSCGKDNVNNTDNSKYNK